LVGLILHLFSSVNKLICPISHNSHQITYILKVFYNDIRVYFNVCTKIIYMHMYVYSSYNESQINIWTLSFLFKSENWYFNYENYYFILFFKIRIWNLIFEFENCYFNCLKHYLNLIFKNWIWYFQFKFKKAYLI
jgi:hypothetical protein